MSNQEQFDLVVIGAGTAGNGVARACSNAGWKVASVDSLPYGGTCALRGCDQELVIVREIGDRRGAVLYPAVRANFA